MSFDFDSCKDGPIVFVNEVVEKKVIQIWERDEVQGQWTSIPGTFNGTGS